MLRVYMKPIGIFPKGKAFPDRVQFFFLQRKRKHLLLPNSVIKDLAHGVDDHRVAAVLNVVAVIADAVDADNKGLVFDGPGLQQGLPGKGAPLGPVGDVDDQIVFRQSILAGLAAPDGEPEVIADQQQDPPAFDGGDEAFVSGGIMFIFPGIGKPVPFVIIAVLTVGQHPDQPVKIFPFLFNDNTARENDLFPGGDGAHPGYRRTLHRFGEEFGAHAEAGGEHFGEDDQFGMYGDPVNLFFQPPEVGGFIFPLKIWLDSGDGERGHID